MTRTSTRRTAAVMIGLGCGIVAAAPAGAFGATHSHATTTKKAHHSKGFYVADQKKTLQVTSKVTPTGLVEDPVGNRHVVTTVKSSSASGDQGHIVYYTRASGRHTKWKAHQVPGLRPLDGIQLQEGLSTDGRRVFVVFFQCNGVFVADASRKSTRLPEPSLVKSEDNCTDPPAASIDPPIAQAVALNFHRVGVLLPGSLPSTYAVWTGTPGNTFSEGPALPTSNSFVPQQITSDGSNGVITAVGEGSDGVNKGIYVTTLQGSTWSSPRQVASLGSPTADYTIESISAYRRSIYVGLFRPGTPSQPKRAGLFTVHGTKSGQWGGVIRLTHSHAHDTSLRLMTNPDTGHLHAAFTRHAPRKAAGILQETRGAHGWNKPKYYSHSGRDVAQQITFSLAGLGVVGYLHT